MTRRDVAPTHVTYRRDFDRLVIGAVGILAVVVGAMLIIALEVTR